MSVEGQGEMFSENLLRVGYAVFGIGLRWLPVYVRGLVAKLWSVPRCTAECEH